MHIHTPDGPEQREAEREESHERDIDDLDVAHALADESAPRLSPTILLAVDLASYACAVVSMEMLARELSPGPAARIGAAVKDFKSAHAKYAMHQSQLSIPAFLRKQI